MTSPRNAASDGERRFYTWRQEKYWSVTTILQAYPKYALVPWTAKLVATDAIDKIDVVKALLEAEDREAAIDMLKRAGERYRDKKAELGSNVHLACEAYALGKPMPPWPLEIRAHMENFVAFLDEYRPEIHLAEASVYSRSERYAGTLDMIGTFRVKLPSLLQQAQEMYDNANPLDRGKKPIPVRTAPMKLLVDVKTGKSLYPEMAMQCAAYRYAEFIGLPDGSERAMPAVDGAGILHLTADGYDFREVDASDNIWRAFLYVREVFRFVNETGKHVIGPTIKPPRRRKAAGGNGAQGDPATAKDTCGETPASTSSGSESATSEAISRTQESSAPVVAVPAAGAASEQPSDPEQTTLLPTGPRTKEEEDALGIDIFGAAI